MNDTDTIFDLIREVQTRTEPFHSQLLAWFLECDPQFRKSFLKAFVPWNFLVNNGVLGRNEECEVPTVRAEYPFGTRERLDVHLQYSHAVIGVEVKVVDGSATPGQLDSYWKNLTESAPEKAKFLIYLTPFNELNAPASEDGRTVRLRAIDEFRESQLGDCGMHVNWNEVACLYPSEARSPFRGLYAQHRNYIERIVCDPSRHQQILEARELPVFFGEEAVQAFFKELDQQGISYEDQEQVIVIPSLENHDNVEGLIKSLQLLIESDELNQSKRPKRRVKVPKEVLDGYLQGKHGVIFSQLLEYFESVPYLWLEGGGDIGVRVAHKNHLGGVSVCTLTGESILIRKER